MRIQDILLIALVGVAIIVWILNLIVKGRLYVGYGVIFIFGMMVALIIISIPRLFRGACWVIRSVSPFSTLALLVVVPLLVLLIYILSQVTIVSDRLARVVQELAIQKAEMETTPEGIQVSTQPQSDGSAPIDPGEGGEQGNG